MRYFKLQNSVGGVLDITTKEMLFHEISGLGFEEENEFRVVGPVWSLDHTQYSQTIVTGKMMFTEEGGTTPYQKFQVFSNFVKQSPLELVYYPHGLDGQSYSKKIRVTSLAKTEINEYGVLDEEVQFTPYTPWYLVDTKSAIVPEDQGLHWIWDVGNLWRDSENEAVGGSRYIFGAEITTIINFECDADGLTKIFILGPATNPQWVHRVNGEIVASGGFDPLSTLVLGEDERLIIDNTEGQYSMIVETAGGVQRNVYSMRDFDKECFFTLKPGRNTISASSSDNSALRVVVEGHILYATV